MTPRTTPQRLRLLVLLLIPAVLLCAAVSWIRVARAGDAAETLRDRRLPAVVALAQVGAALTEADRSATGELASGAFPLTGPGTEYQDAVKTAGQALADARERLGASGADLAQLRAVDGLIIEYTSLVGIAQGGREGALAVAGLVYASELLHTPNTGILARLGELRETQLAEIREARDGFWTSDAALLPLWLCALYAVAVLVVTLVFMRRRFRRHVNVPVALAVMLLLVLAAWSTAQGLRTSDRVDAAAGRAVPELTGLWQARTDAQRVVGAESLALVTRGQGADHRAAAHGAITQLRGETARLTGSPVGTGVRDDVSAMDRVLAALAARGVAPGSAADLSLSDDGTVRLLLGGGPDALTGLAGEIDTALAGVAAESRRSAERDLDAAASDQGLAWGGPLLCAGALAAGLWGLWRRMDEYRAGG